MVTPPLTLHLSKPYRKLTSNVYDRFGESKALRLGGGRLWRFHLFCISLCSFSFGFVSLSTGNPRCSAADGFGVSKCKNIGFSYSFIVFFGFIGFLQGKQRFSTKMSIKPLKNPKNPKKPNKNPNKPLKNPKNLIFQDLEQPGGHKRAR